MILFVSAFFLLLCVVFIFLLRRNHPVETIENTIRIYSVFALLVILPLLALFCLYAGKVNGIPFYASFPKLFLNTLAQNKTSAITTLFTHIFIVFAGLSIPFSTIFYFTSGYRRLLHYYNKTKPALDNQDKATATAKLKTMFLNTIETTGLNTKVRFLVLDRKTDVSVPFFTECGVIGNTGKDITLLLSTDFIKMFETGQLTEQEVESIFFHEISHVYNKDLSLPLWAKNIVSSKTFITVTLLCIMAFIAGFFAKSFSLEHFVVFLVVFPVSIYLFRIGTLQIIAHAMREREYLADVRASSYTSSETLVKAIKKSAVFFPRLNAFFVRGESFSEKSAIIKVPKNFKEFLAYARWNLYCFFTGRTYWHPSAQDRIKAIEEKRNIATEGNIGLLSPASVFGLSFLSCLIGFFILMAYSFLEIGKDRYGNIAISLSFMMSVFIVFLSCLPLRTLDCKGIASLFRKTKFWREMILNSLFISEFNILFLVFGSVKFPDLYILWLFLACTMASLLFTGIGFIVKVDKKQ